MRNKTLNSFILSFAFFLNVNSQVNYVQNPSFEEVDTCDYSYTITNAHNWDSLSAGGLGAAMYTYCTPTATNFFIHQKPRTGSSMAYVYYYSFSTSWLRWRSYIQNKLRDTLVKDKKYCVTHHLLLEWMDRYAVDELGVYFDNGTVAASGGITGNPALVNPQVKSPAGVFFKDTINWMTSQGIYTANGNENYLTIGNFKSQSALTFSLVYPGNTQTIADYFVDDVSVIEADLSAYAGRDTILCTGDSVFIGRPPEIGLDCIWSSNSSTIATGGGLWVKPTGTQTFAVQQNVCGVLKYDTIQVQIKPKYSDASTLTANFTHFCLYDTLKLNLVNPPTNTDVKYQWSSTSSLNNYTITNPFDIVKKSASYSLNINSLGSDIYCPYNISKQITVDLIDSCDVSPTFPNIFTPNNDGANETWGINYNKLSYVKEVSFSIYNRWGNIIFESTRPKMRWDGYTTSGIQCTDGVYFYIAKIKDLNEQTKEYKGNITLIR